MWRWISGKPPEAPSSHPAAAAQRMCSLPAFKGFAFSHSFLNLCSNLPPTTWPGKFNYRLCKRKSHCLSFRQCSLPSSFDPGWDWVRHCCLALHATGDLREPCFFLPFPPCQPGQSAPAFRSSAMLSGDGGPEPASLRGSTLSHRGRTMFHDFFVPP